jgi:hypothetical protein
MRVLLAHLIDDLQLFKKRPSWFITTFFAEVDSQVWLLFLIILAKATDTVRLLFVVDQAFLNVIQAYEALKGIRCLKFFCEAITGLIRAYFILWIIQEDIKQISLHVYFEYFHPRTNKLSKHSCNKYKKS